MKNVIYLLFCTFWLLSCTGTVYPDVTKCSFKIPEKKLYVRTFKFKGGRFGVCFAVDSLLLEKKTEYIECSTGNYLQIVLDSNIGHINSQAVISKMNMNHMEIRMISDSSFRTFFDHSKIKPSYTFISIDTKEYSIHVNGIEIKKGSITGGW